jgi:hypothetical protein
MEEQINHTILDPCTCFENAYCEAGKCAVLHGTPIYVRGELAIDLRTRADSRCEN